MAKESQELRQVHKQKSLQTFRFVEDPQTGRQMRVPSKQFVADDTDRIVHEGETYELQPDGSFYVPVELAKFLTRQPDWHAGPNMFPSAATGDDRARQAARRPKAAASV